MTAVEIDKSPAPSEELTKDSETVHASTGASSSEVVLPPSPLVRVHHGGSSSSGSVELVSETVAQLASLEGPFVMVFALGGSRNGKSTLGNHLLKMDKRESAKKFQVGHTFEPVTAGIDISVAKLASGKYIVYGDCEGSYHPFNELKKKLKNISGT